MATTDTWDSPALDQPINADLPAIKNKFQALVKGDPSLVQNPPVGAKRLAEIDSGNWQVQQYNGRTWSNIGKLKMDVDTVDGYDAAITPQANTIAVRNASGKLEGDIAGNAVSADSAMTLSETLGVELGGTGATTSAAARTNLGVPPTSHTSTATTYGAGNATQYGHVKLSDAVDSASGASGGTAATPAAVKVAKGAADAAQSAADNAQSSADAAMTKASTLATSSVAGIVKPGTGMTVDAAGVLNVSLNNTVTSTSTTQAATANAVKMAYDKAEEAASKAGLPLGHIFAWPFPTAPDGCIILNGSTYDRTLYADFFAYIKAKGWTKTETEWQSIAQANNGFCPWYSEGDGSTNFRTPKFAPYQKIALASGDAGNYYEAGLPDATFKVPTTAIHHTVTGGPSRIYTGNNTASQSLSKINSIYGNSTTVTPESHDWLVCAVAFGVATNVGSVDVADVMSAVGQVQANPNLQGAAHVVESWKSNDGSSWYRKWSDGWIEQGGHQSNNTTAIVVVNLPTPFTTKLYSIGAISFLGDGVPRVTARDTNNFRAASANSSCAFLWIACGY